MSKSKLRSALYSVNECLKQVQGYSFASKADMRHMLNRCLKDLHAQGFKLAHINGLKPKHIHVLVSLWKEQGKKPATIKNYMSKLRKVSLFNNKPELVKPDNDAYSIAKRSYVPTVNKAIFQLDLTHCSDHRIRLSLEAQLLFGLRREESMKIIVSDAWQGNRLVIKPSWTKGGVGRVLEIKNEAQRQWLENASRQITAGQSLIPPDRSYKQHLGYYQQVCREIGISKCHGLRHGYAQNRYKILTQGMDPNKIGLLPPIAGGKTAKQLSRQERQWDRIAREIISRELGHSRLAITKIYCGR